MQVTDEMVTAFCQNVEQHHVLSVDDIRRGITAALAKAWRPIESAPRDGTVIDVWIGDAEPADIDFYCTPGSRRSCEWSWRAGKFRPLGGLSVTVPVFVQPTHWIPLPEPPATKEAGER